MNAQELIRFESLLNHLQKGKPGAKDKVLTLKIYGHPSKKMDLEKSSWQVQGDKSVVTTDSAKGPVVHIVAPQKTAKLLMPVSLYTHFRDQVGEVFAQNKAHKLGAVSVEFIATAEDEELGVLVGLGLASYSFSTYLSESKKASLPKLYLTKSEGSLKKAVVDEAIAITQGTNLARHLVNLPPQDLNPKSYPEVIKAHFAKKKNVTIDVWNEAKLRKEKMGLILAVGQGATHKPCLIHIKYRPAGVSKSLKPLAFVGKGITFDSGGLDIKPSQFMRWMKKDMGGSASVAGLASWVVDHGLKIPCDFYLAVAENAIDADSGRPGDIYTAKNGVSVEIHNTDAEGRLALADALIVAISQKESPQCVIDFATLTGAMKVGLGADLAGYFSTDSAMTAKVREASLQRGDLSWEMPLFEPYESMLASSFADCVNSADGYGGAITAALFLKKFVGETPWMHFDIYAWNDRPQKALQAMGGNGQLVQMWSKLLTDMEQAI